MGTTQLITGRWRLVRAAVVTLVIMAVSMTAHLIGHGGLPGILPLVTLAAVVLATATALAGRHLGFWLLMAVVSCGQAFLHFGFAILSGPQSFESVPGLIHAHHSGHIDPVTLTSILQAGHSSAHPYYVVDVAMLLAHAAASLVLSIALRCWDTALHAALTWLLVPASLLSRNSQGIEFPVLRGAYCTLQARRTWQSHLLPSPRGPPLLLDL